MPPEIFCQARGPSLSALREKFGSIAVIDFSRPDAPYGDLHPARFWRPCPVPSRPGLFALSVEGLWRAHRLAAPQQADYAALQAPRFESEPPDFAKDGFLVPLPAPGQALAASETIGLQELLDRVAAPAYERSLDRDLWPKLQELRSLARQRRIVLIHEPSIPGARLAEVLAARLRS